MDYAQKILDYFGEDESRHHLVVTPHAPPVERSPHDIDIALETIWDDTDIRDTIVGLKGCAEENTLITAGSGIQLELSESFCLSIKGNGRFRVTYLTQRGSMSFSIKRVPFIVHSCDELNINADIVERTLNVLCNPNGGIVAIFGPCADSNSKLAYAMLKRVNSTRRQIILVIERELTHLMRHDNSIVIQRELNSDCNSFNDGIRESLTMSPDMIFVGDIQATDSIPSMVRAAETGTSIILSLVASDRESFLHILKSICGDQYPIFGRRTREIIEVRPLPDKGISAVFAAKSK
jgi:hypothetical protein